MTDAHDGTIARDEWTIRRLGEAGRRRWVLMAHGELYAAEFGWDPLVGPVYELPLR